jgi:dGTPase
MTARTVRTEQWAATHQTADIGGYRYTRPGDANLRLGDHQPVDRETLEAHEHATLAPGATKASGAGDRAVPEPPDPHRTCFQRDRDRIVHAAAFRRLAGKTQVYVRPDDHQRTRLTHALEVAQVAVGIARPLGLNVDLTEAVALGHDCGHGPFGHASEDAFDPYLPGGFVHSTWGADTTLAPLNLTAQVLDGIRNHSWSRPSPATLEGLVVSIADRIAYTGHDFEDAVTAGIVTTDDLPDELAALSGGKRANHLRFFINDVIATSRAAGSVCMSPQAGDALAAWRAFNYERIYTRPASLVQTDRAVRVLRTVVDHYLDRPHLIPDLPADVTSGSPDAAWHAVTWVAGMTDRYAYQEAVAITGREPDRPAGIDL